MGGGGGGGGGKGKIEQLYWTFSIQQERKIFPAMHKCLWEKCYRNCVVINISYLVKCPTLAPGSMFLEPLL